MVAVVAGAVGVMGADVLGLGTASLVVVVPGS